MTPSDAPQQVRQRVAVTIHACRAPGPLKSFVVGHYGHHRHTQTFQTSGGLTSSRAPRILLTRLAITSCSIAVPRALKTVEGCWRSKESEEFCERVAAAVDTALHNVMDLVEGYWATGPLTTESHTRFRFCVSDARPAPIETIDISSGIDLPIGYWKWKDGGSDDVT